MDPRKDQKLSDRYGLGEVPPSSCVECLDGSREVES